MRKATITVALLFLGIGVSAGFLISVSAEEGLIPSWIKNTAGFWANDQISDNEFLNAIQFLINEGILKVGETEQTQTESTFEKTLSELPLVPIGEEELKKLFPTSGDIDRYWKPDTIIKNWFPTFELDEGFDASLKLFYRYVGDETTYPSTLYFEITRFDSAENAKFAMELASRELVLYDFSEPKQFDVNEFGLDENECVIIRNNGLGSFGDEIKTYAFDVLCSRANIVISINTDDQDQGFPHEEHVRAMKAVLGKI